MAWGDILNKLSERHTPKKTSSEKVVDKGMDVVVRY